MEKQYTICNPTHSRAHREQWSGRLPRWEVVELSTHKSKKVVARKGQE